MSDYFKALSGRKVGMAMIQITDLSLMIDKREILKHINLTLEAGRIYGLVGKNGSGKTMLMKCICGFVQPTEGEVRIDGRLIGKDVDFPPDTGIIIETPGFIPYYTGFQNLRFLAGINHRITDKEIKEALIQCGLEPDLKLTVRKYSLGMRQRLGIAQAIMEHPRFLILDEPTNGLDYQGVEEIRRLVLHLKEQGTTILMASHNAEDIQVLCDSVWEMIYGTLIEYKKTV